MQQINKRRRRFTMGHGPMSPLPRVLVRIINRFNTSINGIIKLRLPRCKLKGLTISSMIFKILLSSLPRWFRSSFRLTWVPLPSKLPIPHYAARKGSEQTTAVVRTTTTTGFTCQYYPPMPMGKILILQSCSSPLKVIIHQFIGPLNRPSTLLPCTTTLSSNITTTTVFPPKLHSRFLISLMRA
jgi:hypothetical protein